MLVIVTDKTSTSSDGDVKRAVDILEKDKVKIIALGIGSEVDIPGLDKHFPKENDTISAKGDEDPKKLGHEIVKKILEGIDILFGYFRLFFDLAFCSNAPYSVFKGT